MTGQVYERTVYVWAVPHVINVYQKSKTVWAAVGDYMGEQIEVDSQMGRGSALSITMKKVCSIVYSSQNVLRTEKLCPCSATFCLPKHATLASANSAAPLVALATSQGSLRSFSPHPSSSAWPLLAASAPVANRHYLEQNLSSPESMDINSLASLESGSTSSNPSINLEYSGR